LHELDRVNKHRLLQITAAYMGGFVMDPNKSVNAILGPGIMEILEGPITTDNQ
jgi:hypothetical protein